MIKRCSVECRLYNNNPNLGPCCKTESELRTLSIGDECRFGYELSDGTEDKYLDARGFPLREGFYHFGNNMRDISYVQKESEGWICSSPDCIDHPLNPEVARQHFFPSDLLPKTLEREYRKNADFIKSKLKIPCRSVK